jgi:hypothetical protein
VSTRRAGTWLAVLVVAAGLGVAVWSWEGFDGRTPAYADPRLLVQDENWLVLMVHEKDNGDCLHLRRSGVVVARRCSPSSLLRTYQLDVVTLRGTTEQIVFGMLPDGATRADVVVSGGIAPRRMPGTVLAPLPVRSSGGPGRYIAGPAPAGAKWADVTSVSVEVHDERGIMRAPA